MAHQPRWTMSQVTELFNKPLIDLLFEAQQIHRQHFDPRQVQVSTLLSIKTGACRKIVNIARRAHATKPASKPSA
ncbi:biotin synthase [Klebsiella pneumoniae subsp. pneumoniae]|nr:biotin synthase [Klebsiella pneumoniae subsp. pneumoniae]